MGTSIAPRGRTTLEDALDITLQIKNRAGDLRVTMQSEGLGPFTPIMAALWRLKHECEQTARIIIHVLSDPDFIEAGMFMSLRGRWLDEIQLEASCPRVFPPFVVRTCPTLAWTNRAPIWFGQIWPLACIERGKDSSAATTRRW